VIQVYDDILVPTDGSEAAAEAVERAIDLATTYDARLHVLYVVEPVYTADFDVQGVMDALEAEGREATAAIAERADAAGIEATSAIEFGTPHREILAYADEHGVDLIVMTTHGRTGIDRYLLGSVTEKIVRTAEVPVMTIHAREAAEGDGAEDADDETADPTAARDAPSN
jgi:nucleotide-binding universal stress UspA family protein